MVVGMEAIDLLLVDGDNLLHDVRGSRDEGAVAWLLPRLAAWRAAETRIVLALDGHPAPGIATRPRIVQGIEVRHSGSRSADDLIVSLLEGMPFGERARAVIVTRDRTLRARARAAGGLTRSVEWLMEQLASGRPGGGGSPPPVGIGQGRPRTVRSDVATPATPARNGPDGGEGWQPGRGATRKRGNPRRVARGPRRDRR